MKKASLSIFVLMTFLCISAFAADPAPLTMLKKTADQLLSSLNKTAGNEKAVENVVRKILLPKVDLEAMSRSVIGRHYWTQTTKSQHNQFKKEFVKIVIKTYSAPLANYSGEKIKFYPIRGYRPTDRRVQINSKIFRPNGQVIPVSYRLVKLGNSWKVYDFSVEGVSMIQSYQSQFANTLRQEGFNGLIQQLKQHNRRTN